jgi:quercetin dioxygenase-like cupin family protein
VTKRALFCALLLAGAAFAQEENDPAMLRRVQDLLHAHQGDVYACVQKETQPARGELLIRVFVGEKGQKVARAEVLKNGTGSTTLGRCIDDHIRQWDVSSLKAEEGDQLVFPLAFRPDSKPAVRMEARPVERAMRISDETLVFVLKGTLKLGTEILKADDAAWIGAPATIDRVGGEPAAVVTISVDPSTGGTLGGHPMIAHGSMIRPLTIVGGRGTATLYLDGAGEPIALQKLTTQAGTKIPPHTHDSSDELIYVISGKGMTQIDGKAVFTTAGTTLRIPAGVEHSLSVDEPLVAVQVYAPAGPEQRFKQPPSPAAEGKK